MLLLVDVSGAIKLVLWDKQIDQIAQDSRIRIDGAYVKTWSNERQLHAGRTGIITLLGKRRNLTRPPTCVTIIRDRGDKMDPSKP
jgi:ssDNA-binding replication factor A large subunit